MPSASAPSSSSSSASASPTRHDGAGEPQASSSIYSAVMTPVNFVAFLFSLLIVDVRYNITRAYGHPDTTSRLPPWLHQLVYRRIPYQQRNAVNHDQPGRWYYHSKQKKLMRMEASEAFEMHTSMLLLMAVIAIAATAVSYCVASRLYYAFLAPSWTPVAVAQGGST